VKDTPPRATVDPKRLRRPLTAMDGSFMAEG
jgi:hypothetical protein